MYKNKKDVDKYVDSLKSKLSTKEFQTRAYSVARLYFDVGEYHSSQQYVLQYLTQKPNNAAAHKLLGQTYLKLGQYEKAIEAYKVALDIDPIQTSLILDICELLAGDGIFMDPGRIKFWYEKAAATFPKHPTTFRLNEKLLSLSNPEPDAVMKLLKTELNLRPKDLMLHIRLLKHYLECNKINEAFEFVCDMEFHGSTFMNSYEWYESIAEVLQHNSLKTHDWLYQLLLLTAKERQCCLSLTDIPTGTSKGLVETSIIIMSYNQAINAIISDGASSGSGDFHNNLVIHHKGQLAFYTATFILKKAKKNQLSWTEAINTAAPLMLMAWHTTPVKTKQNWLLKAPEKQKVAFDRWYAEGAFRCSQSGHYLIAISKDKTNSFLDKIGQYCFDQQWKDKLYEMIQIAGVGKTTSKLKFDVYPVIILRLPKKSDVEVYDNDALMSYPNSLHHFVWTLLNYNSYAHFDCSVFNMLTMKSQNLNNCAPETLNRLDILAFLYCAALTVERQKLNQVSYNKIHNDTSRILPANITDLLCTVSQVKWWDCAYKFCQNELGSQLTDIRGTLSHGIEVVRCIDNHGLDVDLLCNLGRIFNERSKNENGVEEKKCLESRARLYYSFAIPLLEKLKNNIMIKLPIKRMFDCAHKDMDPRTVNSLLEESRIFLAVSHLNDGDYEKAIEMLSLLNSPQAYYYLADAYKKLAINENNLSCDIVGQGSKYVSFLSKSKNCALKALDALKGINKNNSLYPNVCELIEQIDVLMHKVDHDSSGGNIVERKYSSDETTSFNISENASLKKPQFQNYSSTPKHSKNSKNSTKFCTAKSSHVLECTNIDYQVLEKIEKQVSSLQMRDYTINEFIEQSRHWFEENRQLGNKIMCTINTNMENTTDQFKLLKISVDQVKDQIDECRNECKEVTILKKEVAELKKEVNKLKKTSEQAVDDNDLYNLHNDSRANETTSSFTPQLPFSAPQVIPPFNQRLLPQFPIPPNPYQLYGPNLYNLYNQYSQCMQSVPIPGAPPLFDPSRPQVNYPGVYPTPDQMYLDIAHLVASTSAPTIPTVPSITTVPSVPMVSAISVPPQTTSSILKHMLSKETKETQRSLPVNVVITSSDPLPTCTTTPAPILSVTIPPQHIKTSPHNYQITMPSMNDTNIQHPFSISTPSNKVSSPNESAVINWHKPSIFQTSSLVSSVSSTLDKSYDKTVVDGNSISSPNTSLNKSRTLSEKSNTSVENYDPCPDFKPIIPLPAEVKVTTGEEDETVIFSSRAKLFRFTNKEWKERGIGEMKLLKHNITEKVRVLMRREQVHKICANHIITADMELKPFQNETKAYFWVANDFAEENVILEKFCIRFKTADIAQQFYETFEKARKDATSSFKNKDDSKPTILELEKINTSSFSNDYKQENTETNKTTVGGFTFSSPPTFKILSTNSKLDNETKEPTTTTNLNVFSNLSFKTASNSAFNNLFKNVPTSSITPVQKQESCHLNSSDTVEDFEPTTEFKPLIPLPALVDQKTGEEDEVILFEHRAKLLRFEASTKEWKERGLGNMKLLLHKENSQKLRLLMRREQVMKICCNHAITKDMVFEKMPNIDKAVTWCAKDFSEGELIPETFCLRFKTSETCSDFIEAIKKAQSQMKDDSKSVNKELNISNQGFQIGFGDKFKPLAGSWLCSSCYTNNLENFEKCACCEQPKPPVKNEALNLVTSKNFWGDKFKPKSGTWECRECLVRNEPVIDICSACSSPKDPAVKNDSQIIPQSTSKCNIFMHNQTATISSPVTSTSTVTPNWGDKFKPKEGTWECQQCLVRNEVNMDVCSACNSAKYPDGVKKESKSIFDNITGPKFKFGIPSNTKSENTSMFDGTGVHKFKFGTSSNQDNASSVITFSGPKSPSNIFGSVKSSEIGNPDNKYLQNNGNNVLFMSSSKPPLLPTPEKDIFINKTEGNSTFEFVFKPKTPPKGKSPNKSLKDDKCSSDVDEYASEDEGNHIHFKPVIALPDKIEVVTGEENEDEVFGMRAKLYRFTSSEWKERGIGIVKILKHKETGKLRIVMRREQVLKICLNHALTSDIIYTPKDDKTWLFAANDYSEGKLSLQQLCLRFKTKEIAIQFKEAVDSALGDKENNYHNNIDNNDDVVFVKEIQASTEDKEKAKKLMLPENFFTYNSKEPCQGCRGCVEDNNDSYKNVQSSNAHNDAKTLSTPENISSDFQSPTVSMYGTPINSNKTTDSLFFQSSVEIDTSTTVQRDTGDDCNNTLDEKPSAGDFKSIFSTPQKFTFNAFHTDTQTPTSMKGSILAVPKLSCINALNTAADESSESKHLFRSAQNQLFGENKSTFGTSINTPTFSSTMDKSIDLKKDVKSIFQSDCEQKPVNLFCGNVQGSIFGPGVLSDNQTKSSTVTESVFNIKNSVTNSIFGASQKENLKVEGKSESQKDQSAKELPFKVDPNLSFASLSTSGSGFNIKKTGDFKWEGEGQQLFTKGSEQKQSVESKLDNSSGDNNETLTEEDYDPHYEPIVPLPEKIVVTTGEEDEEKLYNERCKLYRYDEKERVWKERGVGEIKLLYHPERKTYRLLLRREQVHKAVLNMLLFMDLELLPMKNSDKAWTWACRNYAENTDGIQETLAVRFKSVNLATAFKEKVTECVRKLQAAEAQRIRETKEKNSESLSSVPKLRLPKHLEDGARVDLSEAQGASQSNDSDNAQPAVTNVVSFDGSTAVTSSTEATRTVHFQEPDDSHDDENYEYHEDDDEETVCFSSDAKVEIHRDDTYINSDEALVQVFLDHETCTPRIVITDNATGVLVEMAVYIHTEFHKTDEICSWSGVDDSGTPDVWVTVHFADSSTATQFVEFCMENAADPDADEYYDDS